MTDASGDRSADPSADPSAPARPLEPEPSVWPGDPLDALASLTVALRTPTADPAITVTQCLLSSVGERVVLWGVSYDGTRSRVLALDGRPAKGGWEPASGIVAEVLGARQPVEMGVLDESLLEDIVAPTIGRLEADDAHQRNRAFGRFVPILARPSAVYPSTGSGTGTGTGTGTGGTGGTGTDQQTALSPSAERSTDRRIVAVLGVIRRPGRPLFGRIESVVIDAVAGRFEDALTIGNANAELRSSNVAGLTPMGEGVTLGGDLLDRLGAVSGDVVFRHLFSGRTSYISRGIVASLGYEPSEVIADGGLLNRLVHPDDRHLLNEIVDDPSRCDAPIMLRMLRRNGQISWQYLRLSPITQAGSGPTLATVVLGIEGFATDVTPIKVAEAELVHQARTDVLTGLANRLAFRESVQRAIARLERHAGMSGVLFLDLDGFKKVNDTYGHAAGDDVLRQVAETLRRVIRREDLVARLGGDEFAVLLSELRTVEEGAATARRILAAFEDAPVMVANKPADVSTGIGIAVVTEPTMSPDELINRADVALYQAKRAGRGRWQVHEGAQGALNVDQPTLADGAQPAPSLAGSGASFTPGGAGPAGAPTPGTAGTAGLAGGSGSGSSAPTAPVTRTPLPEVSYAVVRSALAARDFQVHYLPEVNATTGAVVAVEALLRWQHPTLGLLPASVFINDVVGLESIHALGDWALREACRNVASWRSNFRVPIMLWVNVVPAQITRPGFAETVLSTLAAAGLSPKDVGLDVPEALLPLLGEAGEAALNTLGRSGVRLAIDDFGGGTTSLRTLQRLPLSQLKIDRQLIAMVDRPNGTGSSDLVSMAVSLAGSLGADVVAVGVERATQLARVQALRCAFVQGYLAGHALSADEVERVFAAAQPSLPGLDPLS